MVNRKLAAIQHRIWPARTPSPNPFPSTPLRADPASVVTRKFAAIQHRVWPVRTPTPNPFPAMQGRGLILQGHAQSVSLPA